MYQLAIKRLFIVPCSYYALLFNSLSLSLFLSLARAHVGDVMLRVDNWKHHGEREAKSHGVLRRRFFTRVTFPLLSPRSLSLSLSLDKYTRNFQYRCRMVDSSKSLAARLKRQRNQRGATLIPVRRCRLANPATPRLKRSAIECGRGRGDGR